jgi:hypothetical protein
MHRKCAIVVLIAFTTLPGGMGGEIYFSGGNENDRRSVSFASGDGNNLVCLVADKMFDPEFQNVNWLVQRGGTLHASAGMIIATDNFIQTGGDAEFGIGADAGRIAVSRGGGSIRLQGGMALVVDPNYTGPFRPEYTLIVNHTSKQIEGEFANLPEGATLIMGGRTYAISYIEGGVDGGVVLTLVE